MRIHCSLDNPSNNSVKYICSALSPEKLLLLAREINGHHTYGLRDDVEYEREMALSYDDRSIEYILSKLHRLGCVLDIGGGDNKGILRKRRGIRRYPLDPYRGNGKLLVRGCAEQMPYKEDFFNGVFLGNVLFYLDIERAVPEIIRVCKAKAQVVFLFGWGPGSPTDIHPSFVKKVWKNPSKGEYILVIKDARERIVEILSRLGCTDIDFFSTGDAWHVSNIISAKTPARRIDWGV